MEIPMSLTYVCMVNKAQSYEYIYEIVSVLHTKDCRIFITIQLPLKIVRHILCEYKS